MPSSSPKTRRKSAKPLKKRRARAGAPKTLSQKEKDLMAACHEKGIRLTWQRRLLLTILAESRDHPHVEGVYARAHAKDSRISLSTVYRTLSLFESLDIVEKHDFGDGRARYENADKAHHDHLIDMTNGRVIEFRNEEIEKLQLSVVRKLGYRLVHHRLELYAVPLRAVAATQRQKKKRRRTDSS